MAGTFFFVKKIACHPEKAVLDLNVDKSISSSGQGVIPYRRSKSATHENG